jgi:tetratricopeptide (TPR) repeat protein
MPGETSWTWLEAYGRLQLDPEAAHSEDWTAARTAGTAALADLLDHLPEREAAWLTVVDEPPTERLATGSGWGALELARTGWSLSPGTPFPEDTMTARERAWLPLLGGRLPAVETAPDGTLVAWGELLEAAEDNWLVWYHRGVVRHYTGNLPGAVEAWNQSGDNPWALRNLGKVTGELSYYERAVELRPDLVPLVAEAVDLALETDMAVAERMLSTAPDDSRIRLLRARYAVKSGDPAAAHELLAEGIQLATVREGANPLTDLWRATEEALGTQRPVPPQYRFGMGEN